MGWGKESVVRGSVRWWWFDGGGDGGGERVSGQMTVIGQRKSVSQMVMACSRVDWDGRGGVGVKRVSSQRKSVSQMVMACSRVDGGADGMRGGGESVVRWRVYHRWWWPVASWMGIGLDWWW